MHMQVTIDPSPSEHTNVGLSYFTVMMMIRSKEGRVEQRGRGEEIREGAGRRARGERSRVKYPLHEGC